jgi:hypothetical protein
MRAVRGPGPLLERIHTLLIAAAARLTTGQGADEYLELARLAGRLRLGGIQVRITAVVDAAEHGRMRRCLELFEDFCVVTQSVRSGIEVDVAVEPIAQVASSSDARTMSAPAR